MTGTTDDAGAPAAPEVGSGAARVRRRLHVSLRMRFVLGVGVMLLPLLNLAASTWYSLDRMDRALAALTAGTGAVASVQVAEVADVRRQASTVVVVVCAVGVLIAAVVGRLLARSVLRPLHALEHAAVQLGEGHGDHRLRLRRSDEFGVVAAAFDDMADALQRGQQDLTHRATHDVLTGLPNRRLLQARLAEPGRAGAGTTLLLVDLDDFKSVNDSLGHTVGDEVLVAMARRLRSAVGDGGLCVRLGGDEFAVLLGRAADQAHALEQAERVRCALARPVAVAGREITLDATVGVVTRPAGGDPHSLLRDADLAMYAGKRAGGGRAEPFAPALHRQAVARLETEAELRRALTRGELLAHYQPVVDLATGRTVGVEALARWEHPGRGLVPPDEFIGLAEESDLILAVGRQVLQRACADLAGWLAEHPQPGPFGVNVNLSARELQQPGLPDQVREALRRSGLPAEALTLEITETAVMADPQSSLARLRALTDLGVHLAVDDFGTGYSSLAYLQRFPITTLKIDRSFVAPLGLHDGAARLAGGVLRLADTLRLQVTAEGVETHAQAELLHDLGCRRAQGFLYSRPVPLADLAAAAGRTARTGLAASPG